MSKESTFREVVEGNRDRIYRLCCCYVAGADERKDMYQESLINIWRSLDKFEGKSQIGTWIYRVVVNTCLGYLRTERRRKKVFDDGTSVDEIPDRDSREDSVQAASDVERLYKCIDRLSLADRTLVSLYLEELTTKEMADILGISEANVRVKLHRTKKTLREMWEEKTDGPE